jgi:hypothetical protein
MGTAGKVKCTHSFGLSCITKPLYSRYSKLDCKNVSHLYIYARLKPLYNRYSKFCRLALQTKSLYPHTYIYTYKLAYMHRHIHNLPYCRLFLTNTCSPDAKSVSTYTHTHTHTCIHTQRLMHDLPYCRMFQTPALQTRSLYPHTFQPFAFAR